MPKNKNYYPVKGINIDPDVHETISAFTDKYKFQIGKLCSMILKKEMELLKKEGISRIETYATT